MTKTNLPMANLTLAEARGVIREQAIAAGAVEIIDVSVQAAKRAATADPYADKGKVQIHAKALCFCIALASVEEIDRLNILQATLLAMRRAVEGLRLRPTIISRSSDWLSSSAIPRSRPTGWSRQASGRPRSYMA